MKSPGYLPDVKVSLWINRIEICELYKNTSLLLKHLYVLSASRGTKNLMMVVSHPDRLFLLSSLHVHQITEDLITRFTRIWKISFVRQKYIL